MPTYDGLIPQPPPENVAIIPYGRRATRLRRRLAIAIGVSAALAVGMASPRYGRAICERLAYSYQWNRALHFQAPLDTIVYEEDPAHAPTLLQLPDYHRPTKMVFTSTWRAGPPAWWGPPACFRPQALDRILTAERDAAWVCGRHAESKTEHLIIVRCGPAAFGPKEHAIVIEVLSCGRSPAYRGYVIEPARRSILFLDLRSARDTFRLFAGTVDPSDTTHFAMSYRLNDAGGTIDGWLRERVGSIREGAVSIPTRLDIKLKIRDGPATRFVDEF